MGQAPFLTCYVALAIVQKSGFLTHLRDYGLFTLRPRHNMIAISADTSHPPPAPPYNHYNAPIVVFNPHQLLPGTGAGSPLSGIIPEIWAVAA